MLGVCLQHFLNYVLILDNPTIEMMTVRVPTANTTKFTSLEEHYRT
jgi:hypothetical protein